MRTRRVSSVLIALVIATGALAPLHGAPRPEDDGLESIPVQGSVAPKGGFVGTVTLVDCTLDDADRLRLTGVLNGTATHRTGAKTPVTHQPFTASATLHDPGRATDVVRLAIAPFVLDSLGLQIRLAPITVDIYAIPSEGDVLAPLLPES
ncbi:MAG: hypothetical protein M3361_09505 [Candidatus Tectomicrobia bacterium]|nr:hypothetical protein [Candidatus Tectomicrobia bacterium]